MTKAAPQASYALAPLFGEGRDDLVEHVPHARHLGIRVVRTGPCEAVLRVPWRAELVGDPERGVVFGGVITALLDQACGLATFCSLEEIAAIATIDLRIDYLRAAEPGLDLIARAHCTKRTRNVAFLRGTAWDRDPEDPFAICAGTFMLGANTSEHQFAQLLEAAR